LVKVTRFDVVLINLDPTIGREIQKTRPCVIISPDSMNLSQLATVIIAPLTSTIRPNFPTRLNTKFNNRDGQIALDQLRALDKTRMLKHLGKIEGPTQGHVLALLQEIFS
jgi:mRNA interferase MazF